MMKRRNFSDFDIKTVGKAYIKDTKGQFSILFGTSLLMLICGLAVSVDLSSAYFANQRLQDTTDQISLYAAKSGITDSSELTQIAQDYMTLNYPGQQSDDIKINSITRTGDVVTVDASNTIDTDFAAFIGFDKVNVRATSQAEYAQRSLDLAFVLDSTGSMKGTKMKALKSSATGLVSTLQSFKGVEIRASVVPFANYVNVGKSNRNAKWLNAPKDKTVTGKYRCEMKSDVISRTNCRKVNSTCTNDGVTTKCKKTVCDIKRGPEYEVCYTPKWKQAWEGCVGSRKSPLNEQVSYSGKKIPGLPGKICGTEIRPMTKKLNSVKSTIKALDAKGNTYMPAGLAWGWRTLTSGAPLGAANSAKSKDADKVMILMTDGENTRSKSGDWHGGKDTAKADALTASLCSKVKADKIRVYTIAYDITDNDTRDLVKNCASGPALYFAASNAKDLEKAFKDIGESLSTLRLVN